MAIAKRFSRRICKATIGRSQSTGRPCESRDPLPQDVAIAMAGGPSLLNNLSLW
jgi:hypothetical protein